MFAAFHETPFTFPKHYAIFFFCNCSHKTPHAIIVKIWCHPLPNQCLFGGIWFMFKGAQTCSMYIQIYNWKYPIYINTYIRIYIYICVRMYVCIYLSMYVCMYVSMYVCIYTYAQIWNHKLATKVTISGTQTGRGQRWINTPLSKNAPPWDGRHT